METANRLRVGWQVNPPHWRPACHISVWCDHCEFRRSKTRGCLMCAPLVDAMTDLLSNPEFMALLAAVRAAPNDALRRMVAADWLDERGLGELADLFRKTL